MDHLGDELPGVLDRNWRARLRDSLAGRDTEFIHLVMTVAKGASPEERYGIVQT